MFVMHVLGGHASGKSTLLWNLAQQIGMRAIRPVSFRKFPCTVLADGQTILGDYRTMPCIGMDRIKSKAEHLQILDAARQEIPSRCLLWEGVMMNHIGYQAEYAVRRLPVLYVHLNVPLEECFRRIEARSGRSQAMLARNGRAVLIKDVTVRNLPARLRAQGSSVWTLDGLRPSADLAQEIRGYLHHLLGAGSTTYTQ